MTDPTVDPGVDLEIEREIEGLVRARRRARGFCVAARRALALARRYRQEEGPRGERETACVRQALAWRAAARDLRGGASQAMGTGPGLARAGAAPGTTARRRAG